MKISFKSAASSVKAAAVSAAGMTADVAKAGARKVASLTDLVKAKIRIYGKQGEIKALETELGHLYYDSYVSHTPVDPEEEHRLCSEIDVAREQISALRDAVSENRTAAAGEAALDPDDITDDDLIIP